MSSYKYLDLTVRHIPDHGYLGIIVLDGEEAYRSQNFTSELAVALDDVVSTALQVARNESASATDAGTDPSSSPGEHD